VRDEQENVGEGQAEVFRQRATKQEAHVGRLRRVEVGRHEAESQLAVFEQRDRGFQRPRHSLHHSARLAHRRPACAGSDGQLDRSGAQPRLLHGTGNTFQLTGSPRRRPQRRSGGQHSGNSKYLATRE
jgi:hypothetical protein